jgi:hypothetical protein
VIAPRPVALPLKIIVPSKPAPAFPKVAVPQATDQVFNTGIDFFNKKKLAFAMLGPAPRP